MRNSLRGFTLIELVIVLIVLGLMYVVVAPRAATFNDVTRLNVTEAELSQIKTAIMGDASIGYEGFWNHMHRIPTNAEGLGVLTAQGALPAYDPITETGWGGPYLEAINSDGSALDDCYEDAWGGAYHYNELTGCIWSDGPNQADDGAADGSDDIRVYVDTTI